ncbi:MAG: hypothetical protein IT308_04885 [Anaerolineaceae bacterium]|nr:hypothetical protein [Anaerolineaceae bacterium]
MLNLEQPGRMDVPMALDDTTTTSKEIAAKSPRFPWVWSALLLSILLLGVYFRLVGMDWDDDHHLHPDERFMTMVASSVSIPEKWSDYFNTETSSLNPHNRGYGFYVYGTLPLLIVRLVSEAIDQTGYGQIYLVGRYLSAVADLMTVVLVYLTARRLYKNIRIGLVAAAFSAFSVLQIQLSHYFTVDTYTNLFTFLAFYVAIVILTESRPELDPSLPGEEAQSPGRYQWNWLLNSRRTLLPSTLFGAALGMAMASKVSAAPLALLLPAVLLVRLLNAPEQVKERLIIIFLRDLAAAAIVSLVVFRIFQPYAFQGPGFFGLGLNERWIQNLSDLSQQSGGDVDFPPALQWARRPITFAWQNMVVWGLGLPLGLLSWAGFVWMGWRMLKGEWRIHAVLWGWTAIYFVWQSLNFSRSMRYQLPVYPTLAIIASWTIFKLWEKGAGERRSHSGWWKKFNGLKILAAVLGFLSLAGTLAWAFAFSRIYTRPVTRIAASEWIYQNVPSAINLHIETEGEDFQLTLPFRSRKTLTFGDPIVLAFQPRAGGAVQKLTIGHILEPTLNQSQKSIVVSISTDRESLDIIASGLLTGDFRQTDDPRGGAYTVFFDLPAQVERGKTYFLTFRLESPTALNLAGALSLEINTEYGLIQQSLPDLVDTIQLEKNFLSSFNGYRSGTVREVYLPHVVDWEAQPGEKRLRLMIFGDGEEHSALITAPFLPGNDPRGQGHTFVFDPPFQIDAHKTYTIRLEMTMGNGALALYGSKQAIESSWDDPLPYPLEGYNNPFDYEMGVYRSDLNFEMYWDDNVEKRERFQSVLDQADYLFISSNRQWGTTTRVPERYPLTSVFYRNLIGCPAGKDILWCYRVAEPGSFKGNLGFELVQVFQSDPNLGKLRFNTQFAEEAFTVYDHPKVLIFKKTEAYNPDSVSDILGAVDLTKVIHLTPRKAGTAKGNLLLPPDRLVMQLAGGTWSQLFNRATLVNRYPAAGLVLWYLALTLLGWMVYPMMRLAFRGLNDKGYPAAKLFALVVLAYLVWLAGSAGIAFSRLTITSVVVLLAVINGLLAYAQREELRLEWRGKKKYFLAIEGLALLFFAFFLLIRLGNPDLWHPYKGGEKPMDFSYFNAVLKSTTFPPYDPWFAGGYLNYYYYGFVLAGVPVKWLGIIPSVAYNLILPTWFSFLCMGAFSVGWNLLGALPKNETGNPSQEERIPFLQSESFYAGIASSLMLAVFGNLGTVRMIWQGLQKLAAPINLDEGNIFQHIAWFFSGVGKFIEGSSLPYGPGDWYWIPSRVIPGEPITEFPFFTFLYADPHAHLYALPVTVLCLLWAISFLRYPLMEGGISRRSAGLRLVFSLFIGALIIGALRPTNTWDFPTFLALGIIAVIYSSVRTEFRQFFGKLSSLTLAWPVSLAAAGLLLVLAFLLYHPYAAWYGQGYNAMDVWRGDRTPLSSYFTHWGVFLFIIVSWLAWETRDWMAKTPLSALKKLSPYRILIQGILIFLGVLGIGLLLWGVKIALIALPLAAWAAVLILRPGQPVEKRAVLFMIGTALALTMIVEGTTLRGDIGRMNWVFKFYLQAWSLLSLSAAAGLIWLFPAVLQEWRPGLQKAWQAALALLLFGAALFTVMGGLDKVQDRMTNLAPHGLDGMGYMSFSSYDQEGKVMQLAEDAAAIRWMQDHVVGSPVIVEANTPEYRWGSRFTIYTGLPGVLGWNWHQRQQRAIVPSEWVTDRVKEIGDFYSFTDKVLVRSFLKKYSVQFIVVGQLEKAVYPAEGLAKFKEWEGEFWKEVYKNGETSIYQVLP